ncbi:hypothetical protein FDECE_16979 [Fusarium decemcellulare]|nr:hypothetical protein FDECE_16979 [Fusarium decemcellulare]
MILIVVIILYPTLKLPFHKPSDSSSYHNLTQSLSIVVSRALGSIPEEYESRAAPADVEQLHTRADCPEAWDDGYGSVQCDEISVVFPENIFDGDGLTNPDEDHKANVQIKTEGAGGANIDTEVVCNTANYIVSIFDDSYKYSIDIETGNRWMWLGLSGVVHSGNRS